ncbi:uncharacterized protein LOC144126048 [Amblyomma americanum]
MAHVGWDVLKMSGRRRWLRKFNTCLGGPRPLWPVLALSLLLSLAWLCGGRRDWSRDRWVSLAPGRLLVYSAWAEPRGDVHEVRVVSLMAPRGALRGRLLCTLAYLNYSHVQVVAARTDPLNATALTGHRVSHTLEPGFVFCPGDPQLQADEVGLRLVDTSRVHWMPVGHAPPRAGLAAATIAGAPAPSDSSSRVVVCALARREAATEESRLGEFVAHYFALGASQFVFYNQTQSRRARKFFDTLGSVVSVEARYLSWTRRDAHALMAYECALRMRGRADVLVAVNTNEFLVPYSTAGAGTGNLASGTKDATDWSLADARGSVMQLSRKTFCRPAAGDSQEGPLLLSRLHRTEDVRPAGIVVASVDALLDGTVASHHSKQVHVHRYSDEDCPSGGIVVDRSAATAERRMLSSQAMIQWSALFDS